VRLGGFELAVAESLEELAALPPKLDTYGLSCIAAPFKLTEMTDDEAIAFGGLAY
jgi:hypothetical protein